MRHLCARGDAVWLRGLVSPQLLIRCHEIGALGRGAEPQVPDMRPEQSYGLVLGEWRDLSRRARHPGIDAGADAVSTARLDRDRRRT